jgi:hypothetical protein
LIYLYLITITSDVVRFKEGEKKSFSQDANEKSDVTCIQHRHLKAADKQLRNMLLNEEVDILDTEHGIGLRKSIVPKWITLLFEKH